jgi:small subunit ribosomal protein S1
MEDTATQTPAAEQETASTLAAAPAAETPTAPEASANAEAAVEETPAVAAEATNEETPAVAEPVAEATAEETAVVAEAASEEAPAVAEPVVEEAPAAAEAASEEAAVVAVAEEAAVVVAPAAPTEPTNDMTMEEVMNLQDALQAEASLKLKEIQKGDVISGTVVFVGAEGIALNVGAKIEGIIPLAQIAEEPMTVEQAAELFKPGDRIEAYVVRSDLTNSTIILSKKRAEQDRGWRKLSQVFETGGSIVVDIEEKVKGGLVANVEGVRAFLPASQLDVRRVNELDGYVGKPLEVRLIELNRKRNRVIISRRAIIEDQKTKARSETLDRLAPGSVLEGSVVEITDFGVFVNLGGVDGLVHRSELTFGRFGHPREVVKPGDRVQVQVMDVDNGRDRINLSMKVLTPDPWSLVEKYAPSQRISGKVTNLTNFGAFVEIEPGLEGLIHVSEMSWTKRVRHPQEIMKEGDVVEAVILKIDQKERRISLGLRQTTSDPWSTLPAKYPSGTPVKGKVTGLTDFGVFMEIEDGIEGLIHISELAHERVTNPSELFKKGDEIEAVVLSIDPVEQRASLSRKRTLPGGPPESESHSGQGGDHRGGAGGNRGGGDRGGNRGGGGAGGNRGGGNRSGGGGGGGNRRRESGFDYDYNAATTAGGADVGKVTTKLGDVYADLFAQFGLGGAVKKEDEK